MKLGAILSTLIVVFELFPQGGLQAQSDGVTNQVWVDFNYFYPFATEFRARGTIGRRSLVSGGEPWDQTVIIPSIEMYPIPAIDLLAAFGVFITHESVDPDKIELRPTVGFRWNIFQQRFVFRTLTRLESRYFYYRDTTANDHSWRLRARVELVAHINNTSIRDPKTLYVLTDYERFVNLTDEEPGERFANRARFRVGLGWRFDLEWRLELIYTRQESKDTNTSDFETSDNIYRIRFKYQPHRSKTANTPNTNLDQ